MIGLELMFLSNILCLITLSIFFNDIKGQAYALLILAIVASESVLGLSLLFISFKNKKKLYFKNFCFLKG
jgi:NADH-quinone oxidoreductase subunit K